MLALQKNSIRIANTEISTPSAIKIKVVRRFAGSRERLRAIRTRTERLRHWWGPKGWTTPVCEVDFRPGGSWFYCMQEPDGKRYCGKVIYGEIEAPRRFTGIDAFTDEAGNQTDDLPESHIVYEFSEVDGETTVSNITRYVSQAQRDLIIEMGVEAGINQTIDRLDAYLASLE